MLWVVVGGGKVGGLMLEEGLVGHQGLFQVLDLGGAAVQVLWRRHHHVARRHFLLLFFFCCICKKNESF